MTFFVSFLVMTVSFPLELKYDIHQLQRSAAFILNNQWSQVSPLLPLPRCIVSSSSCLEFSIHTAWPFSSIFSNSRSQLLAYHVKCQYPQYLPSTSSSESTAVLESALDYSSSTEYQVSSTTQYAKPRVRVLLYGKGDFCTGEAALLLARRHLCWWYHL